MQEQELQNLKKWFSSYCRSFSMPDAADQRNLDLKEEHTHKVCSNMLAIAGSLRMDQARTRLAETVALFHDVGRFPQYQRYRTFRDSISTNHAGLGAAVLVEQSALASVPEAERGLIVRVVALHNVFVIPADLDQETLLFLEMVRDADKLDIWRVFIEYFLKETDDRPDAAGLGLPNTPEYSPEVLSSLNRREMVMLSDLRTLNDFKLLQLAWIFDLNFRRSLELLAERDYIDRLSATLPKTQEISRAVHVIRGYLAERLSAPA